MRIFVNIRAKRAFNLLYKQCFGQIEKKKITELKNTLQNCKLLKKNCRIIALKCVTKNRTWKTTMKSILLK